MGVRPYDDGPEAWGWAAGFLRGLSCFFVRRLPNAPVRTNALLMTNCIIRTNPVGPANLLAEAVLEGNTSLRALAKPIRI
jgi:hypothetical protein